MRAIVLAAACLGCANVPSTQIDAKAVYGVVGVDGDSQGNATCSATWSVGNGLGATTIELAGGDRVTCNDGTRDVTLIESDLLGHISYSANVAYAPGTTYTITLYYAGKSYVSTVMMPQAVNIGGVAPGQTIKKGTQLTLTWTGAGASGMRFLMDPMLSQSVFQTDGSDDSGLHVTPARFTETLDAAGNMLTGATTATISFTRFLDGNFDATGLNGGTASGTQSQTMNVNLTD